MPASSVHDEAPSDAPFFFTPLLLPPDIALPRCLAIEHIDQTGGETARQLTYLPVERSQVQMREISNETP
jgi:hypothetical protein